MWLVVIFIAFALAAGAYFFFGNYRKKYKLGLLALMLFGAFLMVLIDRTIAFLEGGSFLEATTDGLIASGTLLGMAMLVPIFLIWALAVIRQELLQHRA
jgi:hypothetical protein